MVSFLDRAKLRFSRLLKNKHFKYGVPFISLILLSSKVVSNFAQIRYDAKKQRPVISNEELEAAGSNIRRRKPEEITIEKLHEEYMKKDFKEDYEMVRGPRPWEDSNEDEQTRKWEEARRNNRRVPRPRKSAKSYNI